MYFKLLFLTPASALLSAAGSSPAPAHHIPLPRRGKWPVLIPLLASHVLKGRRKTQLLLTTTVGVFGLFGSISVKGSLEAFFSFPPSLSLQCFFLCPCSVQPRWCLSGDLLLSRAPQQIPWVCTSCSWSATGKLCSDIC